MGSLIERRISLLTVVFFALLALAGLRAAWLGTVSSGKLKQAAVSQQVATVEVPARRGTITDRHGVELAVSEPADDVAANPMLIDDPVRVANRVGPIVGVPAKEMLEKLADRDRGFVYLKRLVPAARTRRLEKLDIEGIDLIPSSRRIYPQKFLASQLLGSVGIDGDGLGGLEYAHDKLLRGRSGERRIVRDALGEAISLRDERAMRAGRNVSLTLDAAIQDRAEKVLGEVGAAFSPKGATAIVMDPRSGELLAVANWPRVDANETGKAPDYARTDRAAQFAYEPGSTFKAFTVAGALQERLVTPRTVFHLPSTIQVADRTIEEAHGGLGTLDTAGILAKSSNVGTVTIGLQMGPQRFDRWVRRFGFGRETGVDLPGEASGIVPRPAEYSGSSMGNLPIGQGLAVTPLQMATGYAAIANGGILRPARIVKSLDGEATERPRGRRIVSARVAGSVRQMLEGVLSAGGTAEEVSIPGYRLAGKTGTAQKPDPVNGGYSDTKYVASFVGFAPARAPRVLVVVMVDEPVGIHLGGAVAAPAVQRILEFALPYLRIAPDDPAAVAQGL
ncbi:MAG TPA: penicillin-binding protein 2 [Solirubrobacteraceae bacterium]|nr:penicillin-binding protein 2 [Solirubrobacteraceae bacterium]